MLVPAVEACRWPRPVRPGDELRVESEVLEVRPVAVASRQGCSSANDDVISTATPCRVLIGTLI